MNAHTLSLPKALVTLLAGGLFGFGLSVATMVQPEVVLGFLQFKNWGLMLVMGGAAGLALLAYKGFPRWFSRPLLGGEFLPSPHSGTVRRSSVRPFLASAGGCRACAPARRWPPWAPATPRCCGRWPVWCWAAWPMA